jgi:eukaryotic-like serine/threonine-protein kinase
MSVKLANIGDVLADKYRVDKILGIGGMGMVVQAVNMDLDLKVALKFMLPQALESPEASARFLREARAAGKLTGEHVCRVMDVGRFPGGAPYIVMEYLEGYDLMTLLKRRGPLPISEAIDYLLQACEGMAEAHALGIVHRDLKPDNLFLASRVDGSKIIKVLDFGISKAAVTGLQTKTGDVLGSPAYMAPEQMQATKDVDARADIWSLGVVLYQLLAGRMAFSGETLPQLCMAVLNEEPKSLMSIRGDIPPPLADAVHRALEKNRNERYDDVSEFAQAIAPFGGATAVGAVTRVRSLLRGRATPQTLPPSAEELMNGSGDVLPTLVGASISGMPVIPRTDDTPVMRNKPAHMPTPMGPGTTTLASSAGESLEIPRRRMPVGVIGVVVGTIGMIVVIVVMAMRRTERDGTQSIVPAAGSVEQAAPPPAPAPAPTVEPIVEPPAPTPAPVVVDQQPEPDPKKPTRTKKKDPPATGSAATTPVVTPDAGAPVDEDKWGKMLDDKPGDKKPEGE